MALFKFVKAMLNDEPIDIYNHGEMMRDFTYVDDIVSGIVALIDRAPIETVPNDSKSEVAPWRVVNIGNDQPVKLMDFVQAVEQSMGKSAKKNFLDMQQGDVPATWADDTLLRELIGDRQATPLQRGVQAFVDWYIKHYHTV